MKKYLLILLILLVPLLTYADNVTPTFINLSALTSGTIPINAKGWTVSIIRGTATINGLVVKGGFSDSDHNLTLSPIIIISGSSSTVYIRYNQ